MLLVANGQTAPALPRGCRGRVVTLIESGVDLTIWSPASAPNPAAGGTGHKTRFVFSGRFVDWKGIQYLVPAFERALRDCDSCHLDLIGGGELFDEVKAMVERAPLQGHVTLHGWVSRLRRPVPGEADVSMPSLRECGGTAILEAMAMGKPVIATNWAGPGDYINADCGITVDPTSKEGFVAVWPTRSCVWPDRLEPAPNSGLEAWNASGMNTSNGGQSRPGRRDHRYTASQTARLSRQTWGASTPGRITTTTASSRTAI